MSKKTVGHVELRWTCPRCNGENPGTLKSCQTCGGPQPPDVQFHQAESAELLQGEQAQAAAATAAAPDIHCPYCGTRNLAGAALCKQCGGDLKDAQARQAGQVVGAYTSQAPEKVKCPNCGTENPHTALRCQNCGASLSPQAQDARPAPVTAKRPNLMPVFLIGGVLALCGLVALIYYLTRPAAAVTGRVVSSGWQLAIPIEALVPVEFRAWQDEVPAGAELGACSQELRSVENEFVPNSVEVCGTPYTVDTGTGIGEVVQDCQYEVYDDYCRYKVDEWQVVDREVASGEGFNPQWPALALATGQRAVEQGIETYTLVFNVDGETYTYTTSNLALWQQAQSDNEWQLTFNRLGSLVEAVP